MEIDTPIEGPTANECLEYCQTFAEVTDTNNAVGMMFLQQTSWNLDEALARFYETMGQRPPKKIRTKPMPSANAPVIDLTSDTEEDEVMVVDESESTEAVREEDLETVDRQHAHLFRLLSWNIDGLSVQSRDFRTPAVVDLIKSEKFHVVCLQEVVNETLTFIKGQLDTFYNVFHPPNIDSFDYFPIICVLKHPGLSVPPNAFKIVPFPSSVMQRILLSLDVVINVPRLLRSNRLANHWVGKPLRVRVWTSHLESCGQFSGERKNQLKLTWDSMLASLRPDSINPPHCGILCGDLNIRDKEIKDLGGVPSGMVDIWESCGARPEAKATWDPRRNPNLQLDNPEPTNKRKNAAYGMRFDRMYLLGHGLKPMDFELRGLERVPRRSHFPSDHWAILGHFDLQNPDSLIV